MLFIEVSVGFSEWLACQGRRMSQARCTTCHASANRLMQTLLSDIQGSPDDTRQVEIRRLLYSKHRQRIAHALLTISIERRYYYQLVL